MVWPSLASLPRRLLDTCAHITIIIATLSLYRLNGQPTSTGSAPQPARSSMSHVVACNAASASLWCARSVFPPTSCVRAPILIPVPHVLSAPQVRLSAQVLLPAKELLPASQVFGFAGASASQVLPVEEHPWSGAQSSGCRLRGQGREATRGTEWLRLRCRALSDARARFDGLGERTSRLHQLIPKSCWTARARTRPNSLAVSIAFAAVPRRRSPHASPRHSLRRCSLRCCSLRSSSCCGAEARKPQCRG